MGLGFTKEFGSTVGLEARFYNGARFYKGVRFDNGARG